MKNRTDAILNQTFANHQELFLEISQWSIFKIANHIHREEYSLVIVSYLHIVFLRNANQFKFNE